MEVKSGGAWVEETPAVVAEELMRCSHEAARHEGCGQCGGPEQCTGKSRLRIAVPHPWHGVHGLRMAPGELLYLLRKHVYSTRGYSSVVDFFCWHVL